MKLPMPIKICLFLLLTFSSLNNGLVCAADKLSLQLPWHHQFQFAGYYMAKELGYYQDAGLDVEIRDVTQGANTVEAVVSGQADFGVSGSGLLVERSLGKPVVAVAAIFQQAPVVFLTLEQSGIRELTDFIGKKVMLSPGVQSLPLIALLHQEQLLDKVERLATSFDVNSLLNGQTDIFNAYRTNEPYLLESLGHKTTIINPQDYGINFYGDTLFTSEAFLKNQPKDLEKFRKASIKGWEYALNHPDEAISVIQTQYQSTKTVDQLQFEATAVRKVIQPDLIDIGTMERSRWAEIAYHLKAIGEVSTKSHLLQDAFLYEPPHGVHWDKLIPWLIGAFVTFVMLLVFISVLSRSNLRLRVTRQQLREEILERKSAVQKLTRFDRLIESSLNEIYIFDIETLRIIDTNKGAQTNLGYTLAELKNMTILDFKAEFTAESFATLANPLHSDPQKKIIFTTSHLRKNQSLYPVEVHLQVIPEHPPVFVAIVLDISERKQAEEALSQSHEIFEKLTNSAKDGIIQINHKGNIVFWNPAATDIFGYSAEEMMGANLHQLLAPEKSREMHQKAFPEFLKTSEGHAVGNALELEGLHKNGQRVPIELSISSFDLQGNRQAMAVIRDISERKKAEQDRLDLEAQLRQKYKMDSVGVMAGGMAHNFNNNLSIILGNIELSKMKMTANKQVDDYLNNAKIAVLRSRDLIQQIMTYSRQGLQEKAPTQLPLVVDETLLLLRSTIPTTINVHKNISSDSRNRTVNVDASQVQECLINLCNNAMHAMEEKGNLTISLETLELTQQDIPAQYDSQPGLFAKLSVQDDGSGMTAETLDKIFDLFYTTKPVDQGTGVGLSTVQGIVKQHGGLIKVNSTVGEGTCFELYFPVVEQPQIEEPTSGNEDQPGGTERILFIDDDQMLANLGKEILTGKGYQVVTMNESTEALKLFAANADSFQLVITDQTMPDLTGAELIPKLREIRPNIPTIICTGFSNKINEDSAKELGINAFLMKPLALPELLQTVRRVLDDVQS